MNIVLAMEQLPVRLRFGSPMNDAELMGFCAANEPWRVEREANGEILLMTPAGGRTSNLNTEFIWLLNTWAHEDGGGLAFDSNGGFRLPDGSMRSPDAAWVARERWQGLTEEEQTGFAPLCPDFVMELRSPSDSLPELAAKMRMWMENGVGEGWMIDPRERTVTVYRAGEPAEEMVDPSSVRGSGRMGGFELVLGRVWG